MADDLDFSKPAGAPKPAAPAAAQAPIYVPAIAKAFFESAGKEEEAAAGMVFFSEKNIAPAATSSSLPADSKNALAIAGT